jgi:hypothetical protein
MMSPYLPKLQQSPLPSAMPVQSVIWKLDPDVPVSNVLTMDQVVSRNTLNASFDASLLSAFAGLSLLLAGGPAVWRLVLHRCTAY